MYSHGSATLPMVLEVWANLLDPCQGRPPNLMNILELSFTVLPAPRGKETGHSFSGLYSASSPLLTGIIFELRGL